MNFLRLFTCVVFLSGCAALGSPSGRMSEGSAASLVERFATLKPPFDSMTSQRALGDPSWMKRVRFRDLSADRVFVGMIPLHEYHDLTRIFEITLKEATSSTDGGYAIYVLVNDRQFASEPALRQFFRGQGDPAMRITELTICYPDGDPHCLNVTPHSRDVIRDYTYHW